MYRPALSGRITVLRVMSLLAGIVPPCACGVVGDDSPSPATESGGQGHAIGRGGGRTGGIRATDVSSAGGRVLTDGYDRGAAANGGAGSVVRELDSHDGALSVDTAAGDGDTGLRGTRSSQTDSSGAHAGSARSRAANAGGAANAGASGGLDGGKDPARVAGGGAGGRSAGATANGGTHFGAAATGGTSSVIADAPVRSDQMTIHIAGDSTACVFPSTDDRVGWGAVLQQFFVAGTTVNDAAQSGRSSKSFMDEGLWDGLKTKIRDGDYVLIQFGHNDEKTDDPTRYTNPATAFRDNLETYISESRAAGGYPVLLTPISRRQFSGTKINTSHGAYPAAVIAVGQQTGTPVIDMTERTRVWLETLGPGPSVAMFAANDNTHLSAKGAPEVAKLVVQGIRDLNLPLGAQLK